MGNTWPNFYHNLLLSVLQLISQKDELNVSNHDHVRHIKRLVGNRHRDRGYALREVTYLSDSMFASMFRLSREGFEELLTLLTPFMYESRVLMAKASSGSNISLRTKLYVTLRWLAGGSYLDICFAWGISPSAFYSDHEEKGELATKSYLD